MSSGGGNKGVDGGADNSTFQVARLVNQHRVDVASLYMLRDIFRKSEHLWTDGLMCSEDDLSTDCLIKYHQ